MTETSRARGCLLGLACGDALGRPVEFRSAQQISERHGEVTEMLGQGTHRQPAGTITDDLVDRTMEYLPFYIGKGVSVDPIIRDLDPKLNVENLTELLRYYFLLTGRRLDLEVTRRDHVEMDLSETGGIHDNQGTPVGVLDFISLLAPRVRTLDPATHQQVNLYDGEIRGRVDWNRTLKQRYGSGDFQGQQYACKVRERTFHTDENRVLIELLAEIKHIYEQFSSDIDAEPQELEWFSPWDKGGTHRELLEAQLTHVHLKKFDRDEIRVDRRTLAAVKNSRNPLYREAAVLLDNYRRITSQNLRDEEARRLLRLQPFSPPDTREGTAALYELYWTFMLLEEFDTPQFKQITSDRGQLIAEWQEAGSQYLLFNDWDGRVHDDAGNYIDYLDISWGPEEIGADPWGEFPAHFMRRRQEILVQQHRIAESVMGMDFDRKTPDIVLLKLDADAPQDQPRLEGLFIGEVKHSDSNNYIKKGLRQLLEYGAHAKFGDQLRWASGSGGPFIADDAEFVGASNFELGYFIGDSSMIRGTPPRGIQICGFDDVPKRPLAE
jgi:hypothetical protein